MKIETIHLDRLIPYARNSRTHSDEQVAQVAASIREFGFTNPVLVDAEGGIIAGHGRVMAARKLGLAEVPCIRLVHLTEAQKRAYVIADNKLALNAGWNEEMLALEFQDLKGMDFDLSLTGYSDPAIDAIMASEIKTITADAMREAEKQTDAAQNTEAAFAAEMSDQNVRGLTPIVPMYAEHHQAFVIVCDNEIDEAWIRNKLKIAAPRKSYKDQKILQANVLTVTQLREAML